MKVYVILQTYYAQEDNDEDEVSIGNVYTTREDAIKEVERLRLLHGYGAQYEEKEVQ